MSETHKRESGDSAHDIQQADCAVRCHGSHPCTGCLTGNPCPACLARMSPQPLSSKNTAGFSLIELLIVIGLLGALTMLVLPRLTITKTWAVDESLVPSEMMDIRRAYAAFEADCLPTCSDKTNFVRSGLAILMTTNFIGASNLSFPLSFDPNRGKGWRGPYLQQEGSCNVNIHLPGQPTNGTDSILIIYDPRHDKDDERYYRVLLRTNDLYLVYIGEDGVLGNGDDLEQPLGIP